MTIFRSPVMGGHIPYSLNCEDIDPLTGLRARSTCKALQNAHPKTQHRPFFKCPRRQNGVEGRCDSMTFLYPRRWASNGKRFHVHQGVDILADRGTPIQSVTVGKVRAASKTLVGGYDGYGMIVVIESTGLDGKPLFFLYAHCDDVLVHAGDDVSEQQVIATVGTTCFTKSSSAARFADSEAHLHFEVSTKPYPLGHSDERAAGDPFPSHGGRLDPRVVLDALGPWGMTAVYVPAGDELTRGLASPRHQAVESSPHGGYFPLGANNHWHGGVHLPAPAGSELIAPFDATIVAARLDPDPTHAMQPDGHTNFILLRHEIPPTYYQLFKGKSPATIDPKPASGKDRAVGTKSRCANDPADVVQVKHKLHEHQRPPTRGHEGDPPRSYYDPKDSADLDDGTVTTDLKQAIAAFQKDAVSSISADGIVDIPGATWSALHDGAPPEEPIKPTTKPGTPSSVPPERVLYSLLMHLQPLAVDRKLAETFPWLARVKLSIDPVTPAPEEPTEEDRARVQQEHEEDLAEAAHILAGAVGSPSSDGVPAQNFFDDVLWVHKRLIRFEFHDGHPSSTCNDELITAIREFQNTHHKVFKNTHKGDGRVDVDGDTVKMLRKTRAELTAGTGSGGGSKRRVEVDPVFVERIRERNADGMAKVITGLDVKVRSGEALWRSGQAQGYASDDRALVMLDQVHWEVFSEHLLVTDWEDPIEDGDDDLTADLPKRLVEFIEAASPELERDGLLMPSEVRELYRSGRGEFLRRTPCRFFSHWALDADKAVVRLEEMGYDIEGLADRLRPFMWWDEARDVLPSTPFVWHYNPIEILALYAEHLAAMRPPEKGDPTTHPTLIVRVHYDDGTPLPNAEVQLLHGITVKRTATTRSDGEALFLAVPVGGYGVRVHDPATAPEAIIVAPLDDEDDSHIVDIYTDVAAPPRPRGSLHVTVRRHTGTIAGDGIEVWLEHATTGPVMNDFTDNGKLSFEAIAHGEYLVVAGDAKPLAVTLDKKHKNVPAILLPPPIVPLHMTLVLDGAPGAGQIMRIIKKGADIVAPQRTDLDGIAEFEVPEGRYEAKVGDHSRGVIAKLGDANRFTMKLSGKDAPKPVELGTLAVTVTRQADGKPALTEAVLVSDAPHGVFEADYPNERGAVTFELIPGTYAVRVAGDERSVDVGAWATTTVDFEVDD